MSNEKSFLYKGTVYFPDSKLKMAAKGVFGSIMVHEAFIGGPYFDHCPESAVEHYIKPGREHLRQSCTAEKIDHGALQIAIEFSNGNIVEFTNSEWGDMTKVDRSKIEPSPI